MNTLAKQHLVVGAGATGWSVAQYLHRLHIPFRVIDSRDAPPFGQQFKALLKSSDIHFGNFTRPWFEENDCVVLSPGVSIDLPPIKKARESGKKVVSDIELFALATDKPYIAVTGSNGKSTVTAMIEKILLDCGRPAIAGGNYGTPALDLLMVEGMQWYVLELSSFQLESTFSLNPEVSVLLNVTDDHLDRHITYEHYRDIKKTVFNRARVCVVNRDQEDLLEGLATDNIMTFGRGVPVQGQFGLRAMPDGLCLCKGNTVLMKASEVTLAGEHGLMNALAAFAVADALNLNRSDVAASIAGFCALPYRCELIAEYEGVRWYNDSKGTNLGATEAAITGLNLRQILICGGIFKGGALQRFKQEVARHVDCVITFGRDKAVFEQLLQDVVDVRSADSLAAVVNLAKSLARPGQAVLFSPACASFDMFDNYVHRGREFNRLVNESLSADG